MASQNRIRDFKNYGKDSQELRRRRNDAQVELRKARKDEQLSKRRNIDTDEGDFGGGIGDKNISQLDNNSSNLSNSSPSNPPPIHINDNTLRKIISDINSCENSRHFSGVQTARRILSRERHPPIDVMIDSGIVPRCVEFLRHNNQPDLQFESAWVLTNIASGNSKQTEIIVKAGAVEPFVELLKSRHTHVVEQAIWALGNIAGDGPSYRDLIINIGIIPLLLHLVNSSSNVSFLRNAAWTVSNLCRGKNPPTPDEPARMCLVAIRRLLTSQMDVEIVSDCCWAISYLSDGSNEKIEDVVDSGIVPRLVALLGCENLNVITPCLRAVGNIVTGSDTQTEAAIKAGLLPHLANLLVNARPNIVKEAAWAVSNVCAGTVDQIQGVIDAGMVPLLINILKLGDYRAQKEACWAFMNITSGGEIHQIILLCRSGVIPAFCNLLTIKDWRLVIVIIDALDNILRAASDYDQIDPVAEAIEECGGLDKLEVLQSHENVQVYQKAFKLIDTFFSAPGGEDENLIPGTEDSNGEFQITVRNNGQNFNL